MMTATPASSLFLEVLLEGASDVPVVHEVLTRRFGLVDDLNYRLHPHRGKGRLPENPNAKAQRHRQTLLGLLPATLRGMAWMPADTMAVVVLVDADGDDCRGLKADLLEMYKSLEKKPANVLFRVAVEETESWFLAQPAAIRSAYPGAKLGQIPKVPPDSVVGAWEVLARTLGRRPDDCDGADKHEWAAAIAPHLDLDRPSSPSLAAFVAGIERLKADTSRST